MKKTTAKVINRVLEASFGISIILIILGYFTSPFPINFGLIGLALMGFMFLAYFGIAVYNASKDLDESLNRKEKDDN